MHLGRKVLKLEFCVFIKLRCFFEKVFQLNSYCFTKSFGDKFRMNGQIMYDYVASVLYAKNERQYTRKWRQAA